MASCSECFDIQIYSGYRIRERTEKEKEVKLSKDVKKLTEYEEGLVQQYKSFLQILENMIKARRQPNGIFSFTYMKIYDYHMSLYNC